MQCFDHLFFLLLDVTYPSFVLFWAPPCLSCFWSTFFFSSSSVCSTLLHRSCCWYTYTFVLFSLHLFLGPVSSALLCSSRLSSLFLPWYKPHWLTGRKTPIYLLTCSLFILGLLFILSFVQPLLILSVFIVDPFFVHCSSHLCSACICSACLFFILYLFIVHPVFVHCSSCFCSSCLCSSCICSVCLCSACLWWVQLTLPFLKNLVVDRSQRPGAKWKKRNCKRYQLNVSMKI